ncbi:MAG TPA: BA14K family protein [Rhizobiaceae bacterium]|nr:BA14K family protein [Rhizobiaceae bacterium]
MRAPWKFLSITAALAAIHLMVPAGESLAFTARPAAVAGGLTPETVQYYPGGRGIYRPNGVYRPYGRPSPRYYGGIYGGVGPYWGPGLTVVVPSRPVYRPYRPVYPTTRPVYRSVEVAPAHVRWCATRYRSYRAWDDTFQPYNGPRRYCISPYR